MCTDLQDLRAKITRKAHSVLVAKSAATGKDVTLLVREILDLWALDEIHAATVMQRLLRSEGLVGEPEGFAGESRGNQRDCIPPDGLRGAR